MLLRLFLSDKLIRRDTTINRIEVKILNCPAVKEAEKNMVFAARLTQRGHRISTMDDLLSLYEQLQKSPELASTLAALISGQKAV